MDAPTQSLGHKKRRALWAQAATMFEGWGPKVFIGLYVLLIFFLVIPSVLLIFMDATWIRSTQHVGLTIVTASIVGVVAFPFLHLLEDASTTRQMVSDIRSSVNRFKWAPVEVDQRSDTKSLVEFVAEHDSPVVFLGFSDVELVRGLLDKIPNRENGELYINPRVLKVLMLLLDEQHKTAMMPERIYVTDCPRDSCTVFGYRQNGERSCVILRGVPLQNKWWSANLSPKSDYTEHLFATYSDIYINSSTVLDSYLKAIFIRNLYHERRNENYNIIQNDRTDVFSWKRVYTYAIDALKSAKKSVYAVDFTPPQLWIAPAGIMYDYRQAHPANLPSEQKIRVHGFIDSQLESDARAYMTFIALHQEMGVQVFFIEKTEIRLRDITQGFVLIDDKVVFSSRDVQEFADRKAITVEDLLHLTESGFVSFEANAVKTYKSRFDNLLRIEASYILTAEKFKGRLAKYIKPGSAPV